MSDVSKEVYIRDDCPKCLEKKGNPGAAVSLGLGLGKQGMVEKVQTRLRELEREEELKLSGKRGEVSSSSRTPVSDEVMETITLGSENDHVQAVQTTTKSATPQQLNTAGPTRNLHDMPKSKRMQKTREEWLSMHSSENGDGLPDKPTSFFSRFSKVFGRTANPSTANREGKEQSEDDIAREWDLVDTAEAKTESEDKSMEHGEWVHIHGR